ncbi:MAG: glycosyltransferase family 4 protein [Hyphomicrobiales bacterium]|nr:glycosyltransferase family 4 protein [Hyphomicrobiales bacterium]
MPMPAELKPAPCHVLMTADAVGGVWNYALDLTRGLWNQNVFVTLAVLGPGPSHAQRCEARRIAGLELIETGLALDWLAETEAQVKEAADGLSRIVQETGANVVQLNGSPLAGLAAFRVPLVGMHHSCLATWWAAVKRKPLRRDWRWRRDLVRRHLASVDRVVVPSAAFADMVTETYGPAERPFVVHNARSPSASLAQVDGQGEALLTAGRLWDEGKDIETLDRAAERLDVPVFAAGPLQGPNGARIDCSHLRLLGELASEEMRARLAARPIFASTSVYEPFGLAVLEAAQAGCALLLSDIPTFRELWEGAALFVPPRDHREFAAAAQRVLSEPVLRGKLGEAARERAKRYSVDRMARAMASLYAALTQDKRVARRETFAASDPRSTLSEGAPA